MSAQKTFKGYAITDTNKWSDFSLVEYPSKKFEETDVEIAITHCGVCGSDVHTITGGWGSFETPMIVGHEIAGTAVRVGSKVQGIKVGDRVGVGAQIGSCYECKYLLGGYSNGIIAHEQFVFPLPAGVSNAEACSMLCGGLTVFSPLVRNGAGPGKKVGIIGVGGLGHYALLFAKGLGAEVYAFTHSHAKEADIKKMGADHIVITEPGFQEQHARNLDLIISTRDAASGFPLAEYLSFVFFDGKFICVGLPDEPIAGIPAAAFVPNGCFFGGSHVGSKKEALAMLALADEKGIKPWIEELPMKECKKAVEGVKNNKVRYRYVLKQDIA